VSEPPDPRQPDDSGLRVGFVPGVTLTKWRRIWDERFPRVPLLVGEVSEDDQRAVLDDGTYDMCFVRLPVDLEGLHRIQLYSEQPVVWMHKDFDLAALDEVTSADLADYRIVADYSPASIDLAVYSAAALRVPLSVARTQSRRDMVHRPLLDAEPTTIALAWRTDNPHRWIDEFIGIVRGRTANSSRTASERAGRTPPDAQPQAGRRAQPTRKKPGERRFRTRRK